MSATPIIEFRDVHCTFMIKQGLFKPHLPLHAVKGVNLKLREGEIRGLVGESGCGKTTVAMMLLRLQEPSSGEILVSGKPIDTLSRRQLSQFIQPIFQDPYSSLNPRKSIYSIVTLPLRVHRIGEPGEWRRRVERMMDLVGLPRQMLNCFPDQLSGGQRQRVAIARALISNPRVVICDEPTSALDVSVQSQILNLLQDLQKDFGLTYLFISHNLAVVDHLATNVSVMYLGRIIEEAPTEQLFSNPSHPYTRALLSSVLTPDSTLGLPITNVHAIFPNPLNRPIGCAFHPRCPNVMAVCSMLEPPRHHVGEGVVECHLLSHEVSTAHRTAGNSNWGLPKAF